MQSHMQRFLNHGLHFNSSYKSMESMSKVMNATPNASVRLPSSKYLIKKFIPPTVAYSYYIKCSSCANYIESKKSSAVCVNCEISIKASEAPYFIIVPIEQQIKRYLDEYLDEILIYNSTINNSDGMADIHNGNMFKNAKKITQIPPFYP